MDIDGTENRPVNCGQQPTATGERTSTINLGNQWQEFLRNVARTGRRLFWENTATSFLVLIVLGAISGFSDGREALALKALCGGSAAAAIILCYRMKRIVNPEELLLDTDGPANPEDLSTQAGHHLRSLQRLTYAAAALSSTSAVLLYFLVPSQLALGVLDNLNNWAPEGLMLKFVAFVVLLGIWGMVMWSRRTKSFSELWWDQRQMTLPVRHREVTGKLLDPGQTSD